MGNKGKPVIKACFPSVTPDSTATTENYADDLGKKPTQRERILYDRLNDFQKRIVVLENAKSATETRYDNSQMLLRNLYQLEKEKHYYMCNAVAAAIFGALGGAVLGGAIDDIDVVRSVIKYPLGLGFLTLSIALGIIKPLCVELLWKFCSKRIHSLKCPHCQTHLTDKEAIKN